MNTEEKQVFLLAEAHLSAEDWAEIEAAFSANDNPWQGAAGDYAGLFSRIVNTAPVPARGPGEDVLGLLFADKVLTGASLEQVVADEAQHRFAALVDGLVEQAGDAPVGLG